MDNFEGYCYDWAEATRSRDRGMIQTEGGTSMRANDSKRNALNHSNIPLPGTTNISGLRDKGFVDLYGS